MARKLLEGCGFGKEARLGSHMIRTHTDIFHLKASTMEFFDKRTEEVAKRDKEKQLDYNIKDGKVQGQ